MSSSICAHNIVTSSLLHTEECYGHTYQGLYVSSSKNLAFCATCISYWSLVHPHSTYTHFILVMHNNPSQPHNAGSSQRCIYYIHRYTCGAVCMSRKLSFDYSSYVKHQILCVIVFGYHP